MALIINLLGILLALFYTMDGNHSVFGSPLAKYNNRDRFNCPKIPSCSCSYVLRDYVISCPASRPAVNVRVRPATYIKIDCLQMDNNVYDFLPDMHLGDIARVQFHRCPLPKEGSIHRILDVLGIYRARSLIFLTNGAGLGDSLKRHHLSGFRDLEQLDLSGNGLTRLPENLFDDLKNLTLLDLSTNNVQLPGNILRNLRKLEYLELGNNSLIDSGILRNQQNLRHLNLWDNNLQNLTKDFFRGVFAIEDLDLSSNNIETLQSDVFENLTNLTNINLNANRFTSLPAGLFAKNKNLSRIRLMDNRIGLDTLPSGFLSGLPALKEVSIICNLRIVPIDMLKDSPNIRNITMASNSLTSLKGDFFIDQRNLLELDLSDNQLYDLSDDLFFNTRALLVLRLSNNQLNRISRSLLLSLINLRELYLDNNNLHSIHRYAFLAPRHLQVLQLENNALSFEPVRESPFQSLTKLKVLNLRNNSIVDILMDWSYNNLGLQSLDLSHNNITYLSYSALQFLARDITVNLSHNSIKEIDLRQLDLIAEMGDDGVSKTHLLLNDNPLRCNCLIMHFIQFYRKELAPAIRSRIRITADNLKCAAPEKMLNRLVEDIVAKDLLCPLDSPNSSTKHCPDGCDCQVRPVDKALIINCSNTQIKEVPVLPDPLHFGFKYTELYIENNNISALPHSNTEGYKHVTEIHARNNSISQILSENLPNGLVVLDVSENRLKTIKSTVFSQLNMTRPLQSISLGRNPWSCDCEAKDLLSFVQTHFKQITDFTKIKCKNGELLTEIENLCTQNRSFVVMVSALISLLGVITGIVVALYYKFQQEIKVWLFAHNIRLWLITEEDLDKDKKYDAFISFSHKDEEFVLEQLMPELENGPKPFKVCLHLRDWVVGEFIQNQISKSVEESRRTIIVLTPSFIESVWGRMEFRAAHQKSLSEGRARVIVIIYGDLGNIDELDPELKVYLKTNTYIKWGDPYFFDKLRYALPHQTSNSSSVNSLDSKVDLIKPAPLTPPKPASEHGVLNEKIIDNNNNNNIRGSHNLNGQINGPYIINTNYTKTI